MVNVILGHVALVSLLVALASSAGGCSSPQPSPSADPRQGERIVGNCGPLEAGLCEEAVKVAEGALPAPHEPLIFVQIMSPSGLMTCPPSGGPPGAHLCEVIVILTTTDASLTLGLVRAGGNGQTWVLSNLIR